MEINEDTFWGSLLWLFLASLIVAFAIGLSRYAWVSASVEAADNYAATEAGEGE